MKGREAVDAALVAAAAKEAAFAKLSQVMRDAVAPHLASTLLENSLRQGEMGSSPALLRRISKTSRGLTDGVFARAITAANGRGVLRLMVEEAQDGTTEVKDISGGAAPAAGVARAGLERGDDEARAGLATDAFRLADDALLA